jgi:DNA replication and repair protein RecF
MVRSLAVDAVSIRTFRNLAAVDLRFCRRFNVLYGENGQGKTNLIEAIYAVLTSKSFRGTKPGELIGHGEGLASVRAKVSEEETSRIQSLGIKPGARLAKIDEKRPPTLAAYAVASPVVVFHPGVVSLTMGGGSERRRLLDRIALYQRPASLGDLDAYEKAVRARQRVLTERGVAAADLAEWEELLVKHGLAVMEARQEASERLAGATLEAFAKIAPQGTALDLRYETNAPWEGAAYRERLRERRIVDLRRGGATVGPHRDDVAMSFGGKPMRGIASQGQHRAVVLSLKLGEIAVIQQTRGVRPVLLLDDVSSELDEKRTAALFEALRTHVGQVFLTTTRPEIIDRAEVFLGEERWDFRVQGGEIRPCETTGFGHGSHPANLRESGARDALE